MFIICFFFDLLVAIATPIAQLAGATDAQIAEGVVNVRAQLGC